MPGRQPTYEVFRELPRRAAVPGRRIAVAAFVLAHVLIIALLAAPRGLIVADPGPLSGAATTVAAEHASGAP